MKKLYFTITTSDPIIITQHSDDPNMYETLQYIRGTIIQGVFAHAYLESKKPADKDFIRLIVSGDCSFSNAYPLENKTMFFPAPAALVREKTNTEQVHNLLVDKTDEQTQGISSFIAIDNDTITPLRINKNINLHNEIDSKTRISKDGILFNYQSLPAKMAFKGFVAIKNDDDEKILKKLIQNGMMIRVGRSTTSEYGKAYFNWTSESKNGKTNNDGEVIMTLLSDTIVLNSNGFSSLRTIDLNNYLVNTDIVKSISKKSRIDGFLNVWKLRKPSENVFAAGSTFLLNKLPSNHEYLETFGLGERNHEGYGQVSFSLLNMQDKQLKYTEQIEVVEEVQPSIQEIPEMSGLIIKTITYNRIKEQIIIQALQDAENTEPKIDSNNLLSRLKEIASDTDKFREFLKDLRQTAKGHLEKSYLGEKNLIDHFNSVLSGDLTIQYQDIISDEKKRKLKTLYFEQYLNQLRRLNKNKK